jgi:type VI secretion system protein ImpG
MFRDIYAAELEYLYGLAAELGREQTRLAPMLGRDADVGMSRLAQTVAFLSARVRQRLEDDLPDFIHPVVESLRPWLLRPLPSATIVELIPDPAMKEPQAVAAGSVFTSRPIDGAPCVFRSTTEIQVRPWALEGVEIASERSEIRLRLALLPDAVPGNLAGSLRLFFALPVAAALELRTKILRTTTSVTARAAGGKTEVTLVSEEAPITPGNAAVSALVPEHADPLFALRAYLTWPEQFAFVDLPNLDRLASLPGKNRAFEIVLRFRAPLSKSLALDPSVLRLHCVPAINVHAPPSKNATLVRGRCAIELGEAHLYAIEQVTLVNEDLSTRAARPYARIFPPAIGPDGRLPLLYRIERVPSVLGPELDVALVFVDLARNGGPVSAASVDVSVLVTDGERAVRVGVGELCVPSPASPPLVSFRNVTPVTRSAPPPLEGDRLWRWFALLKTPFWQLTERSALVEALALANLAAWARWPGSKPSADAFEGVVAVRATRLTRPGRDEVFPGARVEVDVDRDRFSGAGDIDLFGECLVNLFASALREHEWLELAIRDEGGTTICDYPLRFGTRSEL